MNVNRPAIKFILPFLAGIILGWNYDFQLDDVLVVLSVLTVSYAALFLFPGMKSLSSPFLFIVILLFGTVKITYDGKFRPSDNVSRFVSSGRKVYLKGSVAELPRLSGQSVRFIIDAESLRISGDYFRVRGGVLVSVLNKNCTASAVKSIQYSRDVALHGVLVSLRRVRNPGEFDLMRYLNLNGVYASFYPDKCDSSDFSSTPDNDFLSRFVYPVRHSIAQRIDELIGGEEAKFLKGLLVGDRSEIQAEVKTAFINSGTMHILAVSGLHVAIVTFIIFTLLKIMRIPEITRIVITCILLLYYIYLTGSSPSVSRSVIMALIILGARIFQRKNDMYNTLAVSALVLLTADSRQLFDPGFQLSYAAVFSIIFIFPKIAGLRRYLPKSVAENPILSTTVAAFSISVAAGMGTLPFISFYFGKIPLLGFVANLVIVPFSNLILALGTVTVGLSYLSSWLASVYAGVTSWMTYILVESVGFLGNLPFACSDVRLTVWSSVLFYLLAGLALSIGCNRNRGKKVIALLAVLNIGLYGFYGLGSGTGSFRVTILDVGQGDAIFLEFPGGKKILVDAGPAGFGMDAGTRFILPYLRFKGVKNMDAVITHPDADHIGGIAAILRSGNVDRVYSAGSVSGSELHKEYNFLIDSIKLRRSLLKSGGTITGLKKVRVYVMHPSDDFLIGGGKKNLNDESIVLKIVFGRTSVLLTGDAGTGAEAAMLNVYGDFLKSDVLKVAHHGSISGSSPQFVRTVGPEIAVISVGAKNIFNHPSPGILERLESAGCFCYRTDESGAIVLESDGEKWSVVDWK